MSSKRIVILYGSETGNAYDYAAMLSAKLHRFHFAHTFTSLGDYNRQDILKCRYMFVLCSTTGQGELPRNVNERSYGSERDDTLWKFLKKKNLPEDFMSQVNVGFFGLGDSSYPNFNYAIRKLHKRMVVQLGASEIFDRLEADEISMAGSNKNTGSGTETVYFEFEKRVLGYLCNKFPNRKVNGEVVKREELSDEIFLEPESYLKIQHNGTASTTNITNQKLRFEGDSSVKTGRVVLNKRITSSEHFQDVRQFVFHGESDEIYYPGDTVAIFPFNTDENVEKLLEVQPQWKDIADRPLEFTNDIPSQYLNGGIIKPITLRNLLKYHCDFMSIPRASFFMNIWTFATDVTRMERGQEQLTQQREKLKQFGTDKDMQDLYDYCNRPRRSILEVLEDFLSIRLPWTYVLDYLPPIKPRFFSISSSACNPDIELTIAIIKYKTILRKIRTGLCTQYISSLKNGESIRYKICRNNLFKNQTKNNPMLLVSPGVGIAPMMSLIRSGSSQNITLIFGCRYKDKDYLYQDYLEECSSTGKISLYTVFSRDRENSPDVKYVQDVIWKLGQQVCDLIIKDRAIIYLCGASGKMPIQVRITFLELLKKWGGFSSDREAEAYLKEMEKNGHYLQETW